MNPIAGYGFLLSHKAPAQQALPGPDTRFTYVHGFFGGARPPLTLSPAGVAFDRDYRAIMELTMLNSLPIRTGRFADTLTSAHARLAEKRGWFVLSFQRTFTAYLVR